MTSLVNKIILRLVIYIYLLLLSVSLGPEIYMSAGRSFIFVDSYISDIDTPYYSNDTTRAMLEHFNYYGNGMAVKWQSSGKTLARPITIKELDSFTGEVVGQAIPMPHACKITIKKGLDLETYYNVLLHEYLHCLGYTHSKDRRDLMYYSVSYCPEDNIIKYAKDIEKRNR